MPNNANAADEKIVLICLSVIGFILAIISAFLGLIAGITAEGFSQGGTNLALIAIALALYFKIGNQGD